MSYIDISMPLKHGMAGYPGDPPVTFSKILNIAEGANANLTLYSFGSHCATHFDAPYHMFEDGKKAADFPADYFIGKAQVFSFMLGEDIKLEDIISFNIKKGDIVLFKTPNSDLPHDKFIKDFTAVTPEAAEYLIKAGVRAVGVDYLSIERFEDTADLTHRILLGAGVPIIEGLDLSKVSEGVYKMTAMFMLIEGSDGAPLRAILEKY